MTKELKIEIPKGYEIDKEKSTFEHIVFKKVLNINTYGDLKALTEPKQMYYLNDSSEIESKCLMYCDINRAYVLTKKEAKMQRAIGMISHLMPYYGGAISTKEWKDKSIMKYIIRRIDNKFDLCSFLTFYYYLAFRTKEDRDRFLKENERLVKDYLMLD